MRIPRALWALPAIGLGIGGFVLLKGTADEPAREPPGETAARVRVVPAVRLDVVPAALGYGVARPARVWQAVPQLGGRVVHVHPRLKTGENLPAGEVLVRIDPADYELAVRQAKEQIRSLEAETARLDARADTWRATSAIEKESLALAERELARVQQLVVDGAAGGAERDKEARNVLAQKGRVQEIDNQLALIEPERAVLAAKRDLEASRLARAELDLARTVLVAPFLCRVAEVAVETEQTVQPGQTLCTLDGIESTEVTAHVPMSRMRHLVPPSEGTVDVTELTDVAARLGFAATVRLRIGAREVSWPAEFVRVQGIDPQTRTIGLDVAVADPFGKTRPGIRPPLMKGMYVAVELRGPVRKGVLAIPRAAVREGGVLVVDADGRLARRAVTLAFEQGDLAAVADGVREGERVLLSDPVPAVPGRLLDPENDAAAAAAVRASAGAPR